MGCSFVIQPIMQGKNTFLVEVTRQEVEEKASQNQSSTAGVPKPWSTDCYWSVACWERPHKQQVSKQSFIWTCMRSRFYLWNHPPLFPCFRPICERQFFFRSLSIESEKLGITDLLNPHLRFIGTICQLLFLLEIGVGFFTFNWDPSFWKSIILGSELQKDVEPVWLLCEECGVSFHSWVSFSVTFHLLILN